MPAFALLLIKASILCFCNSSAFGFLLQASSQPLCFLAPLLIFLHSFTIIIFKFCKPYPRACLKNHSRHLYVPFCAIFASNSVDVARYASFIWHKSPTNCAEHLTESIFQTRSRIKKTVTPAKNILTSIPKPSILYLSNKHAHYKRYA